MNPAIKMVATIIVAAIITTLAVLVGMIILGLVPGHERHTGTTVSHLMHDTNSPQTRS